MQDTSYGNLYVHDPDHRATVGILLFLPAFAGRPEWDGSRRLVIDAPRHIGGRIMAMLFEKRDEIDRVLANPVAYQMERVAVLTLVGAMEFDGDHAMAHRVLGYLV